MLEIKNLSKTYLTTSAPPVHALRSVSVKLESVGMVFVLGKSGSGKSTFLNVVGGLDKYDSGEIIIKGKSSNEFKGSDFDSYRNTYLGFIFQEYNLINEFTIGQNIALAMELQGEHATDEKIEEILQLVDLGGMKDRMPLQISGGQRQRVAIARALIKNPEIIMADEPTGALDSNTGAAIFSTLQNLAKSRLVLIVSHDREFAEMYGDRIIEFSDGEIISDMIKEGESFLETVASEEIESIERVVLEAKSKSLSSESIAVLNTILQEKQENAKRTKKTLKRGVFVPTDESKLDISNNGIPFRLIKSRLPQKNAVKMAKSSMNHKKIRLFMSIFLSILAVSLFGFSFVMGSFSSRNVYKSILRDNGYKHMIISKLIEEKSNLFSDGASGYVGFSDENEEKIRRITGSGIGKFFDFSMDIFYGDANLDDKYNIDYFPYKFSGMVFSDELDNMGLNVLSVYGRYPVMADEVLISNYVAEAYLNLGISYKDNGEAKTMQPESINDILSYTIQTSRIGIPLKIVGIIDFPIAKYEELKMKDSYEKASNVLKQEFEERKNYDLTYIYGMSELQSYYAYYNSYTSYSLDLDLPDLYTQGEDGYGAVESFGVGYDAVSNIAHYATYVGKNGSEMTRPKKGEVILDLSTYIRMRDMYSGKATWETEYVFDETELSDLAEELGVFERKVEINVCPAHMFRSNVSYNFSSEKYDVIGVISSNSPRLFGYSTIGIFDDDELAEITKDAYVEMIFVYLEDMTIANKFIDNFVGKFSTDFKGVLESYTARIPFSENVTSIGYLFESFALVFLILSLIICLLAALLLLNFISASVAHKKKEIGILRAIGARKIDVMSIFLWEGAIIGCIVLAISVLLTTVAIIVYNNLMGAVVGLYFTLLVFEFFPLLFMTLVCFGTIALASILPSIKVASLKPMDAIRSL